MVVEMPVLDLGEVGEAVEDAIQGNPAIAAGDDPQPAAAEEPDTTPDESEPPAADAAEDFETRYQARFAEEYAAKSKEDIKKLQSKLDRQIGEWRTKATDASGQLEEHQAFIAYLSDQLAEYDPDLVRKLTQGRQAFLKDQARDRELKQYQQTTLADKRRAWYQEQFGGQIDPDDELLALAFQRGDEELEKRLLAERVKTLKPKAETPKTELAKTEPPARDEQGRFTSRAEATRQREQARGREPVGRGATVPDRPASTLAEGREAMARGFARLGLPG